MPQPFSNTLLLLQVLLAKGSAMVAPWEARPVMQRACWSLMPSSSSQGIIQEAAEQGVEAPAPVKAGSCCKGY